MRLTGPRRFGDCLVRRCAPLRRRFFSHDSIIGEPGQSPVSVHRLAGRWRERAIAASQLNHLVGPRRGRHAQPPRRDRARPSSRPSDSESWTILLQALNKRESVRVADNGFDKLGAVRHCEPAVRAQYSSQWTGAGLLDVSRCSRFLSWILEIIHGSRKILVDNMIRQTTSAKNGTRIEFVPSLSPGPPIPFRRRRSRSNLRPALGEPASPPTRNPERCAELAI